MMTAKKTPDGIASASKSEKSKEHLTTTTDQGKIELTEQELNRVSGGSGSGAHIRKAIF
jgi:bacteriocin-like protein